MRILIANRGEIAVRIARTIESLEHTAVGLLPYGYSNKLLSTVCSEITHFDHTCDDLQSTYLSVENIIKIALTYNIQAIHPGYGFLSESSLLSHACEDNKIIFIGPTKETLTLLGDKVASKQLAEKHNIPTIKGFEIREGESIDSILQRADTITYPLIIKASYGGGGRGMRVVESSLELEGAITSARSEAKRAFGNGALFIEKYIYPARHIEVQLLGDTHGSCIHLFERDCSLQRRHQKVIEIAPSTNISKKTRELLFENSVTIGKSSQLTNAATVEFLVDNNENYYFIECNPRLQVEHTITEEITGLDIVKLQILTALGEALPLQTSIIKSGYAIQARICAELPEKDFTPSTGYIDQLHIPANTRIDNGYSQGEYVTTDYDSLLFKVISRSESYTDALLKLSSTLEEVLISGVFTNIPFLLKLVFDDRVKNNEIYTKLIEEISRNTHDLDLQKNTETLVKKASSFMSTFLFSTLKNNFSFQKTFLLQIPQLDFERILDIPIMFSTSDVQSVKLHSIENHIPSFTTYTLTSMGYHLHLTTDFTEQNSKTKESEESGELKAPLPCTVLKVFVKNSDHIDRDQPLLSYESMKTEYTLLAPFSGKIDSIQCKEGDRLYKDDIFLFLESSINHA